MAAMWNSTNDGDVFPPLEALNLAAETRSLRTKFVAKRTQESKPLTIALATFVLILGQIKVSGVLCRKGVDSVKRMLLLIRDEHNIEIAT